VVARGGPVNMIRLLRITRSAVRSIEIASTKQTAQLSEFHDLSPGMFLEVYSAVVEKTKLEARKKGYSVSEQTLETGSIRLQILEGA
jgi:hypothetical protein